MSHSLHLNVKARQRGSSFDGTRNIQFFSLFSIFKNFRENLVLEGVVKAWIIPSIQRVEMVFRQLGLLALGLCCLISKV